MPDVLMPDSLQSLTKNPSAALAECIQEPLSQRRFPPTTQGAVSLSSVAQVHVCELIAMWASQRARATCPLSHLDIFLLGVRSKGSKPNFSFPADEPFSSDRCWAQRHRPPGSRILPRPQVYAPILSTTALRVLPA